MKKNILILLSVLLILVVSALKFGVPYAANKILLEKAASHTGYNYSWGKITFSLLRFDLIVNDVKVAKVVRKKSEEVFVAERIVLKRIDLFNGATPEYLESELKGVFIGGGDDLLVDLEPLMNDDGQSSKMDLMLKIEKKEQGLYVLGCKVHSSNLDSVSIEAEASQFSYGNWQQAAVDKLTLSFIDEKQVASIVADEMKRQNVSSREALIEKLQKSVGFALTVDNLGRNYLDLSLLEKDEAKRLDLKKEILTLLKDGRGVTIEYNKRHNGMLRLGELSSLSIRDLARNMEYELSVVK